MDSDFCNALLSARAGATYREPYAKILRISEHIIMQANTLGGDGDVYTELYYIMKEAWLCMLAEECIQESFDLD